MIRRFRKSQLPSFRASLAASYSRYAALPVDRDLARMQVDLLSRSQQEVDLPEPDSDKTDADERLRH